MLPHNNTSFFINVDQINFMFTTPKCGIYDYDNLWYPNVIMQSYMPSNCCHFNDYGHNYLIIDTTTNMTIITITNNGFNRCEYG